uniref:ATM interactor n=1 Tax=Myxine glutinosa TaxID=7769 RepID=UPI00358EEB91
MMRDTCEMVCPSMSELGREVATNLLCPVLHCGRRLPNPPALSMHLVKSHRIQGANCYSFSQREALRPRSLAKVFCCPVPGCPRGPARPFLEFGRVRQHFLKMHAERRHHCDQCTRAFGTASDLARHQGACGRLFSCSCGCPYASRNGLLSHVARTGHKLPEEHRDPPTRKRRLLEGMPATQTSVSVVSLPSVSCARPMGDRAEGQGESSTSKSSTPALHHATRHGSAIRARHKSGMIEAHKLTKRGGRTSFCVSNRPAGRRVLKRLLPKPGAVAIIMTALQLHSPSLILLNPSSPFHTPISEVCRLVSSDYHNNYREGSVLHSLPTAFGASHCSSDTLERVSQQHPAKQMREDRLSTTVVNTTVGLETSMDASSPALAISKAVLQQVKAATMRQSKLNSPVANSQQVASDAAKTFNPDYSMSENHLAEKVSLPLHAVSNSVCGNHKESAHASPLGRGCSPPGVMDGFFPDYSEATGDAREGTAIDMQTQTSDFNTFLEQLFINTNTPFGRPSSATTYETSSQTELPFATEGYLGGMVDGATQTPWLDSALNLFDTQTQTDFDRLFSSPACSVVTGYDFQSDSEIQISSLETAQNLGSHQSSETQTEVQFCPGEKNYFESSVVQDVFNLVPHGTALDETILPVFISLGRVGDGTFSGCSADIPAPSLDSETQTELELAFHIDSFDDGPLAASSAFTMTPSSLLDTETQTDSAAGGVRAPLNSTETQTPRTDLDDFFFTSIETQTVEDDFLLADVDFSMGEHPSPSYCGLPSPDPNDTTGVADKSGTSNLLSDFEF